MPPLTSIDSLIAQSERPVYVICPYPEWPHYDLNNFPAPLAEWMSQNFPDVSIAQLPCLTELNLVYFGEENEDKAISDLTHSPIFLVGFNEEQAAHFAEAWKNPQLDTPESPDNFYFLTCGGRETFKSQDDDFDLYLFTTEALAMKQGSEEALDGEIDFTRMKDVDLPLHEHS